MLENCTENLTLDECMIFNRKFGITLAVTDGKDVQVDIEPGIYVSTLGVLVVE